METGAWRVWWQWERVCQAENIEWCCKRTGEVQMISENLIWVERIPGLWEKKPTSMECSCRKEWSFGGGSGAGFIDNLVKRGKWSDGDPMGARDSRSKWRVGRGYDQIKYVIFVVRREVNVLTKMKEERRDRNWEVRVSAGLSRWMLKSPVMINSWGMVAANERKELKSSRKTENGLE